MKFGNKNFLMKPVGIKCAFCYLLVMVKFLNKRYKNVSQH